MPDTTFPTDLGDADGTRGGSDFIDEATKVVDAIIAGNGGSSVHQPPGSEEPGTGVWH